MQEMSLSQQLRVEALKQAVRLAAATDQEWTREEILTEAKAFEGFLRTGLVK